VVPVAVTVNEAICPAVTAWFDGLLVIAAGTVTLNVAALLVSLPRLLLTIQRNREPLSAVVVIGVVYDAAVAPPIFTLFFCHWYVRGAVPVAVIVNVAVWPTTTVRFDGLLVIEAGIEGVITLRMAVLLVELPEPLLTMQRYSEPLSAVVVIGVVYDAAVAPPMFALFFCHW
jgi:hypothetical protein